MIDITKPKCYIKFRQVLLSAVLVLGACAAGYVAHTALPAGSDDSSVYASAHPSGEASASRIIVKLQDELGATEAPTGNTSLDHTMAQFGAQSLSPLFNAAQGNVILKEELGLSRTYVMTIPASSDLQAALSVFSGDPNVEYAEPDSIGRGAGMPDDSWFPHQWNLHNTGQMSGVPDADVDAPEAWDVSTGITATVLCIIDTGVDLDHEDLTGQLVDGYDFVNDDATPPIPLV